MKKMATTSLFFDLLPTDLQIHVLLVWLNNETMGCDLMKVLSSLDIACAVSYEKSWRDLLRHIPPFGGFGSTPWSPNEVTMHMMTYMLWLCSRRVAVRSLVVIMDHDPGMAAILQGKHPHLTLPSIEVITFDGGIFNMLGERVADVVQAVLRYCPNVNTLQFRRNVPCTDAIMAKFPKLKTLSIELSAYSWGRLNLRTLPPLLLKLRLDHRSPLGKRTAKLIGKHCPHLQVLKVDYPTCISTIVQLLVDCKQLRDLELRGEKMVREVDIAQILAKPQVKKLAISMSRDTKRSDNACTVFANLLELRPDIEELQLYSCCKYSCIARTVSIVSNSVDKADLFRILSCCITIDDFTLTQINFQEELAKVIHTICSGRLKSLRISMWKTRQAIHALEIVLQNCPLLTSLTIGGDASDSMLAVVAVQCPQLEMLTLQLANKSCGQFEVMTGDGLDNLFAHCPLIKYLCLVGATKKILTLKPLQSVIIHRLSLRQLELWHTDCPAETAVWIRHQAKKQQLLPAPKVIIQHSGNVNFLFRGSQFC